MSRTIEVVIPAEIDEALSAAVDVGEFATETDAIRDALAEWSRKRRSQTSEAAKLRSLTERLAARTRNSPVVARMEQEMANRNGDIAFRIQNVKAIINSCCNKLNQGDTTIADFALVDELEMNGTRNVFVYCDIGRAVFVNGVRVWIEKYFPDDKDGCIKAINEAIALSPSVDPRTNSQKLKLRR